MYIKLQPTIKLWFCEYVQICKNEMVYITTNVQYFFTPYYIYIYIY